MHMVAFHTYVEALGRQNDVLLSIDSGLAGCHRRLNPKQGLRKSPNVKPLMNSLELGALMVTGLTGYPPNCIHILAALLAR